MPQDRDRESLDAKYQRHHRMYNRERGESDDSRDSYSRRRDRQLIGHSSRSDRQSRSRSRSRSPQDNNSPDCLQSANKSDNKSNTSSSGIQMKLTKNETSTVTQASKPADTKPSSTKKLNVAAVFNEDDDEEPEEMPCFARMRMKNVGRETPTSAGPNSFGKTKIGFCNVTHITEKKRNV